MKQLALALGIVTAFALACGDDGGNDENAAITARCETGCTATLEANCANGPGSQSECVGDCVDLSLGECATTYNSYQNCAEGEVITCSSDLGDIPIVEACMRQLNAFLSCINARAAIGTAVSS